MGLCLSVKCSISLCLQVFVYPTYWGGAVVEFPFSVKSKGIFFESAGYKCVPWYVFT